VSLTARALASSLQLAHPAFVHVNRGNHEDEDMSWAYDLAVEMDTKYGAASKSLLHEFGTVFSMLPLGAVIPGNAFIVHGGLPRNNMDIPRLKSVCRGSRIRNVCQVRQQHESEGKAAESAKMSEAHLTVQDLLWSDPVGGAENWPSDDDDEAQGQVRVNHRRGGTGVLYSPDAIERWLAEHELIRFIRSHEVVHGGAVSFPLISHDHLGIEGDRSRHQGREHWTVFTSSCYPRGDGVNSAAVLILPGGASWKGLPRTPRVVSWKLEEEPLDQEAHTTVLRQNLVSTLWRHRATLSEEWEKRARADGKISVRDWANVLCQVIPGTESKVWRALLPLLGGVVRSDRGAVNFSQQIRLIGSEYARSQGEVIAGRNPAGTSSFASALYRDPDLVRAMFALIDSDHSGTIAFSELEQVVHRLNEQQKDMVFPPLDAQSLWNLLDRDGSGEIDVNEFAEGTRVS